MPPKNIMIPQIRSKTSASIWNPPGKESMRTVISPMRAAEARITSTHTG
ncbi:MAG: hypothetical protein IT392_10320 [Nitrospirae bacterium]|nr:hypothetical protein [Nitrospirota bacterium]